MVARSRRVGIPARPCDLIRLWRPLRTSRLEVLETPTPKEPGSWLSCRPSRSSTSSGRLRDLRPGLAQREQRLQSSHTAASDEDTRTVLGTHGQSVGGCLAGSIGPKACAPFVVPRSFDSWTVKAGERWNSNFVIAWLVASGRPADRRSLAAACGRASRIGSRVEAARRKGASARRWPALLARFMPGRCGRRLVHTEISPAAFAANASRRSSLATRPSCSSRASIRGQSPRQSTARRTRRLWRRHGANM